jgi:predicted nuclease of restriction endonuclease-like (RecB) superfamily
MRHRLTFFDATFFLTEHDPTIILYERRTMKPVLARRHAADLDTSALSRVLPQIQSLIDASRQHVVSTANLTLVWLYWNVGRIITEDIQKNQKRVGYGEHLFRGLTKELIREYGSGYSHSNLKDMRRFFEVFVILPAVPVKSCSDGIRPAMPAESGNPKTLPRAAATSEPRLTIDFAKHFHLGWTHYRTLLGVEAGLKRAFYFEQAASQRWATRELQRQIERALFERVALARGTRALVHLEKQRGPVEMVRYEDVFKDPYLLDFHGLKDAYSEKDLEAAIIANLQQFLTELGSDFCFIRRQYPMRIGGDDYWLDLLFYQRGRHCLVAIDLHPVRYSRHEHVLLFTFCGA